MRPCRLELVISAVLGIGVLSFAAGALAKSASIASPETSTTVVSLTFDDGYESQWAKALPILQAYGMRATFYVNSGTIETAGKLTWDQVAALQAAGNEIGGHSTYHPDFRNLDLGEVQRQVCNDRTELISRGLRVTSFAFPYGHGANDPVIKAVVRDCGYNSARRVNGLSRATLCPLKHTCAESIPPRDPYAVRIPERSGGINLAWLQSIVLAAEADGGGWVPIMFHAICECLGIDVTPKTLTDFLAWLRDRKWLGTSVQTVDEVIGGDVAQPVQGPPPSPRSGNLLRNPSFEVRPLRLHGAVLLAECLNGRAGTKGRAKYTWADTADAHSGVHAEQLTLTSIGKGMWWTAVTTHDLGMCAVAVTPGKSYQLSGWYHSNSPVIFSAYYQRNNLQWLPLRLSDRFPASANWTEATWTVDLLPGDATELSVGLGLNQVGSVTMDDFSLVDAGVGIPVPMKVAGGRPRWLDWP
jgi:peptidoglycan/xylan/chitin deacetylase (PgdA/CDA1 family)